jgi:hypothetical protein
VSLGAQTVTIVDRGTPTSYDASGDPVYGSPTLTVVRGCSLQQMRSSRDISNLSDITTTLSTLFAPPSAPLKSNSIVVEGAINSWPLADGDTTRWYLADGFPANWVDFNGIPSHIESLLRQQEG